MPEDKPSRPHRAVIPSMNRRMHGYDYSRPGYYMVTIKVANYVGRLSAVSGRAYKPGTYLPETDLAYRPNLELSENGELVASVLRELSANLPVEVKCAVIMPDHAHILLKITEHYPRKLAGIISSLKGSCSRRYWESHPEYQGQAFWQKGYNDIPLYAKDSLTRLFNYIKDNPRRYLIRKSMPEYFYRRWQFDFDGRTFHAIGNIFLLQYHTKVPIRFSRRFSVEEMTKREALYRAVAAQGDVLISTFIHPMERAITKECVASGARLIWLRTNGFPERSMVKGERAYEMCAKGSLLMIAPDEYHTQKEALTRDFCLTLNTLAEYIAQNDIHPTPLSK